MCTSLQDYIGQAKMVESYFIPCGQICGALREMKSAKQVMQEIVDQAVQILDEELPAKVKTRE
jgi:hypothetical protein